ncbi:MutS protein msh4 [Cymbomonas tetramitiformis]|uniref:MutS protein msh4 n=1 Tax=Cymbomonas tetramitiformis TaxID=36881 RepID=A0AAE0LDL4_9CHLO|nr:MutS protein msh4 [Cymbomonas tetramitiformis]
MHGNKMIIRVLFLSISGYLEVDISAGGLAFKYNLAEGKLAIRNYGLQLAKVAGMPETIVNAAAVIVAGIDAKETGRITKAFAMHEKLKLYYSIGQRLVCLQQSNMADLNNMGACLNSLKMEAIEGLKSLPK